MGHLYHGYVTNNQRVSKYPTLLFIVFPVHDLSLALLKYMLLVLNKIYFGGNAPY
jgi:hypothetical protein